MIRMPKYARVDHLGMHIFHPSMLSMIKSPAYFNVLSALNWKFNSNKVRADLAPKTRKIKLLCITLRMDGRKFEAIQQIARPTVAENTPRQNV